MTVELGQTADPVALNPGDPGALEASARVLSAYGDVLTLAGDGLARIDTTDGWRGQAADAFRRVYHGQPHQWVQAGGAFHEAAQALSSYASMLAWAQGQAHEAIQVWHTGKAGQTAAASILASARGQLASAGNTAAGSVGRARDLAPPAPGFWSQVGSFFAGVGRGAEAVGAGVADGVLSVGNALISHPGADAAMIGWHLAGRGQCRR